MDQEIKITAEPKDDTCKFTVNPPVYPGGSIYFGSKEGALGSPLAEKLLAIDGVAAVLVQDDLVTVTAEEIPDDWRPIGKQVGAAIRAVLSSGQRPVSEAALASIPPAEEIQRKVQEIFDNEINPAVAAHGGYVELIDVKGNEVFLRLGGGCQGCGMADVTLKQGIERSIRAAVPYVGAIMDTTDHAGGRNPYYAPSK